MKAKGDGDVDSLSSSRSLSKISLHSKDSLDDEIQDGDDDDKVSRDSIDDEITDNEPDDGNNGNDLYEEGNEKKLSELEY